MTMIPGTDLTTDAARHRATRMLNEHDAALMVALADAYEALSAASLDVVIDTAKRVADLDKYSPPESAAAWDVVDALTTLRTRGEHVTVDPTEDDHTGKQISRAAETEDPTDECD
jgi:hypothetical protein